MQTKHSFIFKNASCLSEIKDGEVDLVVTSPPYPMIEMWDSIFVLEDPSIEKELSNGNGKTAFEKMNLILDNVWSEMDRVLKPGGIICINIGDATRTINKSFSLYPSHSRILSFFYERDYYCLPEILWRKQVNSPNKFMGSGMLPVGAYTTLEHEYVLVLRKGTNRREFKKESDKCNRRSSAFFWEERNLWFSDIWFDIKGAGQKLANDLIRERSAAFPFDLPYRLINMFSVKGDIVLDPFLGTGTTTLAAAVAERSSIGAEVVKEFKPIIDKRMYDLPELSKSVVHKRIEDHISFVEERERSGKILKYENKFFNIPVISKQEVDIHFGVVDEVLRKDRDFIVNYL